MKLVLIMTEEMEDIEEISVEEALEMEAIFSQALMDVMVAKGLITEQEVIDRVEEIKEETGFELG
jgi:secreted Zn-dependent insulinase-like peptidase